jgi:putative oxidoreductase
MRSEGANPPVGLAILRVVIGVIFIAHGAPKLFGGGVEGLAEMLGGLGVPLAGVSAWIVTLLEFFGGLALVVGFLVVPVALLLSFHMLMGIVLVHSPNGFYVIGPGQGGVEFNLLLIAGLLTLMLAGPGFAALDARRRAAEPVTAGGGTGGAPGGDPSDRPVRGGPAGGVGEAADAGDEPAGGRPGG